MNKTIITLKLTREQEETLFRAWSEEPLPKPAYAKWQIRPENCVITCYLSGKTVFQGKDAEVYAAPFMNIHQPESHHASYPQAGSDEVGTGDYFGPVCVCATYVAQENCDFLTSLGVRDSKQMTDADMLKIAPTIIERIPHSLLILLPKKYNQVHLDNNLNAIKAKLHNQAYINLSKKITLPPLKIIDQFAPETSYYRYIHKERQIIRQIHFETKAEDKYISVAAASIIARYGFLKTWQEMEKTYDMHFHKGSGNAVDECAKIFVQRYGFEKLHEVAKIHFKNTEKVRGISI